MTFRKTFSELLWATVKAMVIVLMIETIMLGVTFYKAELTTGFLDAFGSAILLSLLGFIIMGPFIAIFVLCMGTPLARFVSTQNWNNKFIYALCGAIITVVSFKIFSLVMSEDSVTFAAIVSGNAMNAIGGALAGFFYYRQIISHFRI